jgi:hypothetical protein
VTLEKGPGQLMKRWMMVALLLVILLAACGGGGTRGQALLEDRCTGCHSLDRVTSANKTVEQWGATVDRMIVRGAELTDAERDVLVEYLAKEY